MGESLSQTLRANAAETSPYLVSRWGVCLPRNDSTC
jgi:hypothetical protein